MYPNPDVPDPCPLQPFPPPGVLPCTASFQGQDPVGQRIAFDRVPDSNSVWRPIVGGVVDERQNQPSGVAEPEFYAPFSQDGRHGMILVVRTRNDPNTIITPVRRVVSRLDPALAISGIRTMEDVRSESLSRDRFCHHPHTGVRRGLARARTGRRVRGRRAGGAAQDSGRRPGSRRAAPAGPIHAKCCGVTDLGGRQRLVRSNLISKPCRSRILPCRSMR